MSKLILYGAPISSCSFRVRIALALKGLQHEDISLTSTAARRTAEYAGLNPQQLVPLFIHGNIKISQSIAIMEYMEETWPDTPLLPTDAEGRARVRSISQYVVSEVQPLQNTRLNPYLQGLGVDDFAWAKHWVKYGLEHLEAELAGRGAGKFCHGDTPTMADACLVPQLWNAVHRYQTPLGPFPRLASIWESCLQVEAFQAAMPERQAGYQAPAAPPAAA